MPGVASTAIRSAFSKPDTPATVLGTASHAIWVLAESDVVVVSTSDATRLPNGVEIAADAAADTFRTVQHGSPVTIGSSQMVFDELTIDVVRWWDPRPVLRRTSAAHLAAAIAGLPTTVPDIESGPLASALSADSAPQILEAAAALIGRGPGLTPEGDDYLAGALSATRTLGEALGDPDLASLMDSVAGPLERLVSSRTTTFSAALIRHAIAGRVAAPAAALLRALTGRGDVARTHRDLTAVGHTSGPALAAGMILGAHSLLQSQITPHQITPQRR